jgi:UDP-glucose 4-epimerase
VTARSPAWRRALVTGATGFLGRALVSSLTSSGVEVTGTSRSPRDGHADVRWFTGDLADESCATDAVRHADPDVIFHLSGAVTGSRDVGVTLPTYHSLLTSTVNLLVAATREGSPTFVLAGSMEDSLGADVPASPYAAAKEAARRYAAMFHRLHGLPTVTARIFMVYGPGRQDERRFVPYVIRSLQRGSDLRLSSGRRPVDWVYVDDVVEGLIALASHEAVVGRTVDVGTGETHTVREVGERLRSIMGALSELPWGSAEDRLFEQVAVADVQPALELCGWRARTALPDGLTRTVDWFRADSGADE